MFEVNRSVAVLRPKQPFIDWLRTLPGGWDTPPSAATLADACNALLVPAHDEPEALRAYVRAHGDTLFAAELADWCDDERLWPEDRSAARFAEWFDIAVFPVVTDLDEAPLEREPFVPFDLDAD